MRRAAVWLLAAALAAVPLTTAAEANYTAGGGTVGTGVNNAIAIGASGDVAPVASKDNTIAIGNGAQATMIGNTAVGAAAQATGGNSTAL